MIPQLSNLKEDLESHGLDVRWDDDRYTLVIQDDHDEITFFWDEENSRINFTTWNDCR